jgi:malonyl-CoA O-methyltransferase
VELEPREAYRLWAENYPPRAHNVLMQVEQQAMLALLPDVYQHRVLDLACGTGRYALLLKERGAQVIGLDLSHEMLGHADVNLFRVQSDLMQVPLPSGWADLIVCGLAIGHVQNLALALIEMARLLKPGGVALYSDFHPLGRSLGWQRTFRAPTGKQYAVQFVTHTLEAHQQAAQAAGFSVEMTEVQVDQELATTNADAAGYRLKWGDAPVALVIRAHKN